MGHSSKSRENGYANPNGTPAAEVKIEPLMYADDTGRFYSSAEGRAKFINLPPLFDPAVVTRQNNAKLTNVYALSSLTRKQGVLGSVQEGESLTLVREPLAEEGFATIAIYTHQGQRLGLIEDEKLAYYIDTEYVDVSSVKAVEIDPGGPRTVTKRVRSTQVNVTAAYDFDGKTETVSFTVAGASFYPEGVGTLKKGCELTFKREPDNPYSANAIAICGPTGKIAGHVPETLAGEWAPMIDNGRITELHGTAGEVIRPGTRTVTEDHLAYLIVEIVFTYDDTLVVASNLTNDFKIVTPHAKLQMAWSADDEETEDEGTSSELFAYYKDSIGDILLALAERKFFRKEDKYYSELEDNEYCANLNVNEDLWNLFRKERLIRVSDEAKHDPIQYNIELDESKEFMLDQFISIRCYCREKFLIDFIDDLGTALDMPKSETPYIAHNLNWYLRSIGKEPVRLPPVIPKSAKPRQKKKAVPAPAPAAAAVPQTTAEYAEDGLPVYRVPEVEVKKDNGGWKFKEDTENGEKVYHLLDYTGKESHIIMPAKIGGVRVAGIDPSLYRPFNKCKASEIEIPGCYGSLDFRLLENNLYVRKITIGEGITKIGDLCTGAQNLEEVQVSRSVRSINGSSFRPSLWCEQQGDYAAVNDILLGYKGESETMAVPAGITTIATLLDATQNTAVDGEPAIRYVKKIILPDTVKTICEYAFSGEGFTQVDALEYTDSICYIGSGALDRTEWMRKRKNETVIVGKCLYRSAARTGEVTIPDGIEAIGAFSFKEASITAVHIPASVKTIGCEAFAKCSCLERIEIPGPVITIEEGAFKECTALKEVHFESRVGRIGEDAFSKCVSLEAVELPASVVEIGASAFAKCEHLARINIPTSLHSLGHHAFADCKSLEKVVIPAGLTVVPWAAFSGCKKLKEVSLPQTCNRIGNHAFSRCTSLAHIDLPPVLTSIGDGAFWECTSLVHIDLPPALTAIGESAFMQCISLTDVVLPQSVKELGPLAFSRCSALTSITLPAVVGPSAFSYCEKLQRVEFDANTVDISAATFGGCVSLNEIILPQGVKTVGKNAFKNCTSLRRVKLPESIQTIGYDAFKGCTALTDVEMPDKQIEIERDAFERTPYQRRHGRSTAENAGAALDFLITEGTLTEYLGTDAAVVVPDGVTVIGDKAFANAKFIKSLTLPDSVTEIGENLFGYEHKYPFVWDDCWSNYPKGYGSTVALSLTLGKNVRKISDRAFSGRAIGEITLPETLETIGDYAFVGNTVEVVHIPKSVKKVGAGAFYGAKELVVYDTLDPDAVEAAEWKMDPWNGSLNSRLAVALLNPIDGTSECQGNTSWCSYHITVLSAQTGDVKYRIWCEHNENQRYRALMYSAWGKNASFKFKEYDEHFKYAYNPAERTEMAFCRLQYPYQLAPEHRAEYENHLERCVTIEQAARRTARCIGQRDEVERLVLLRQYNALNTRNVRWMLEELAICGTEKCTTFLQKLIDDREVQ